MTHSATVLVAACLAAATASAALAKTTFTATPIAVSGNTDVDATAINVHGAIVATVFDTAHGTQSGVILDRGAVTTLPAPYAGSGAPIPQAINASGDVLGYAYEGIQPHLFLYRGGQYEADADVTLVIEQQQGPAPLPIGLNRHDAVFYTIITGQQNPTDPIYGKLPHVRSMPYLMRYQTAHGLNAAGTLSGTTFYSNASQVFAGHGKAFTTLLPPQAVSAAGGFINDAGTVAGTYTDSSNVQHGFTWSAGTYTSFDLPEAAAPYSAFVTGINESGRVVGYYTSQATGHQRAFLYNGAAVTAFGHYSRADALTVTLNDKGSILLSRQIKQQAAHYGSYIVQCKGAGC